MSELGANAPPSEKAGRHSGWFWGGYARLGVATLLPTLAIDQAHKWWINWT